MVHLVLDGPILSAAMQTFAPGSVGPVAALFDMARQKRVRLWVHPHALTKVLDDIPPEDRPSASAVLSSMLDVVGLLPNTAVQLSDTLAQSPRDPVQRLTARSGADYLGEFIVVSEQHFFDAPDVRVLAPADVLAEIEGRNQAGPVRFIDLKSQQHAIYPALENNIFQVLSSCSFILGPDVERLEKRLGEYTRTEHVVSCSSGTEALLLALMAHGIGPGDAVLTTPFTFIATAEVISLVGATPAFVDIDPRTFNLDSERLASALAAFSTKDPSVHPLPLGYDRLTPKAVITVDLFGLPADHERINALAGRYGLPVIEDAAQSFGGSCRGRMACGLSDVGCTSFYPAKPLGAYGEGGACFTNDPGMAEAMRSIRVHGQSRSRYEHARIGTNGRLDSMQAAVLLAKLDVFPSELSLREQAARRYTRLFGNSTELIPPSVPEGYTSAWSQYSLLAPDQTRRDECRDRLSARNIPSMIHYPVPLHLQEVFGFLGYRGGDFPVAEATAQRIFSLPMHPYLSADEQERIAVLLNGASCTAKETTGGRPWEKPSSSESA
jgi:UDP-2-acetamido-2-deoxy-ribo-hexuluronate aminotransferase